MGDRILRRNDVLGRVGFSSATLHRKIKAGEFEPPVRLGPNSVGWRESAIEAYIHQLQTAEPVQVATGARRGRKPRRSQEDNNEI